MRFLRNKFALIWLFGVFVASLVWLLSSTSNDVFARLDTFVFDTYQRLQPRVWGGSDITIVDIDEESIEKIGQWPWPRTVLAEMTDRLGELGAAVVAFDVVFSEADRTSPLRAIDSLRSAGATIQLPAKLDVLDNDRAFERAIERNGVVTGMILSRTGRSEPPSPKAGVGFSGTVPPDFMQDGIKAVRNLPLFDEAAAGTGDLGFDAAQQTDGVVRKTVLLRGANGHYHPSLAMEILRVAQGAGGFKIKTSDGSGEVSGGNLSVVSTQVGALTIPTDSTGAVDIYHSPSAEKPVVPVHAILSAGENSAERDKLRSEVENHIILIGTSAAGLLDLRATPLEPIVSGVTIQAEIIDQIVSGQYLARPDYARGAELVLAILAVLIMLALLPFLRPLGKGFLAAALVALVLCSFWYAFSVHGFLFTPVVPVLSVLAAYTAAVLVDLLVTEKEGRFVREAFSHYLAPAMVERLAADPESLRLGGEDKELTILFCDIRGFTSLSENLAPTELTELLNNFLTPMTTALLERGATIDKYIGDAIMAFWNAPLDQEDHRSLACAGLRDMRKALKDINARSKKPINIGIGLNTGPCCVGNLGSTQRFNYSAIGDAVNVASRVEGMTKYFGLDNLVAQETLQGVDSEFALEIDRVSVVGREAPLTVWTLLDEDVDDLFELKNAHNRMLEAYRIGAVETGRTALTILLGIAQKNRELSLAKLYGIYQERFRTLEEDGVPENWDGVFRATSK